jgi:hypothetical protein
LGKYPTLDVAQSVLKKQDIKEGYYAGDDLPDEEVVKGARVDF